MVTKYTEYTKYTECRKVLWESGEVNVFIKLQEVFREAVYFVYFVYVPEVMVSNDMEMCSGGLHKIHSVLAIKYEPPHTPQATNLHQASMDLRHMLCYVMRCLASESRTHDR